MRASQSTTWLTGLAMASLAVLPAVAAELSVRAARINGTPVMGGPSTAVTVDAGDQLSVEFYLSGWSPDLLRAYQLQVDSAGYASGSSGTLVPDPLGAVVDTGHPGYVFSGADPGNPPPPNPPEVFAVVDTSQVDYRWASTLTDPGDSISDPGGTHYVGTLELSVSGDASGVFTLALNGAANGSFLRDDGDPPAAVSVTFVPLAITVDSGSVCVDAASCCDLDSNTITDDVCNWCSCEASACNVIAKVVPADISGAFGACMPDMFCNIHDRNQALSCFAGTTSCATINIDAGGSFGTCAQDGFCNIHDANHALSCFAGTNTCACGAMPETPGGGDVGQATLKSVASRRDLSPGERVEVRVFVDSTAALQAYQLELATSGGRRGGLQIEAITIEDRADALLASGRFDAVNLTRGQVLAGLDDVSVGARAGGAYLATFTLRASADAAGTFVVDVAHNETSGDQTFLVAPHQGRVVVDESLPATIHVVGKAGSRGR